MTGVLLDGDLSNRSSAARLRRSNHRAKDVYAYASQGGGHTRSKRARFGRFLISIFNFDSRRWLGKSGFAMTFDSTSVLRSEPDPNSVRTFNLIGNSANPCSPFPAESPRDVSTNKVNMADGAR